MKFTSFRLMDRIVYFKVFTFNQSHSKDLISSNKSKLKALTIL